MIRDLAQNYDGFIVDLWGVVHDGIKTYPGVIDCLTQLRAALGALQAVLALEDAGAGRHDPALARGLAWLAANQQPDGTWSAASINKLRDPKTDAAPFMTDAATAYAVLALQNARGR